MKKILLTISVLISALTMMADDGHALWLRMTPNAKNAKVEVVAEVFKEPIIKTAQTELARYWKDNRKVRLVLNHSVNADDGYSISITDAEVTVNASTPNGLLYGAYELLRLQQTNNIQHSTFNIQHSTFNIQHSTLNTQPSTFNTQHSTFNFKPSTPLRILNHWDNPNGTVERGYAGRSIFWPSEESTVKFGTKEYDERLREYGRANASIGINATVLNNVNAKALMLDKEKLSQTKHIADVLRPYGIRVFLSVNFASPKVIGGLATADPLDAEVQAWWKKKADEIYKMIPDFGGFLVKANSEGEPGPMDYGRTHVDGANMLADALKPHRGTVMWRAFVYSPSSPDRASQAYDEFMPFDGQFRDNVIIQIKNGPVDFQPREATSSLFYGLKRTKMMPEFQITQEYTGESVHTCFLASMWEEFYHSITSVGSMQGTAGVANIGDTRNWCGSDMAQANWYAFGRMAWNKDITPEQIAREWLALTYSTDSDFINPMTRVLSNSREAVVHYMMPLGLHHIFAGGHHYGPEPWCNPNGWREDWKPRYYHRADSTGLGFNRTTNGGTSNTRQYPDSLFLIYNNVETCPEQLLLWFHHVPWNYRMHSGETMWNTLCHTYDQGVREANAFADIWNSMKPYVDAERFAEQKANFDRQAKEAIWWRDACILYFQQFSKMPLPLDSPTPVHILKQMMDFKIDIDNYTRAPYGL